MAFVTLAEALKLTTYDLQKGVYENAICVDEFLPIIPFMTTEGGAYAYNRENALADAIAFTAPGTQITAVAQASFTLKTSVPITFAGIARIEMFVDEGMSDYNDQVAIQISAKAKSVGRLAAKHLAVGMSDVTIASYTNCAHDNESGVSGVYAIGDTNEADSLISLCDASQYSYEAVGGAAFDIDVFDQLLRLMKLRKPDCFVMHPCIKDAYKDKLRAKGGVDTAMIQLPNYAHPAGPPIRQLAYEGIPVLTNEWIPTNFDDGQGNLDTTQIYAVCLGEDAFHGISKGSLDAGLIRVTAPQKMSGFLANEIDVFAWWNFVLKSKYGLAIKAWVNA